MAIPTFHQAAGRYRMVNAPAGGFSPADVADLVIWVSADDGAYTDAGSTLATDGQNVQQLNDRNGGTNFEQATSAQRPTLQTNELNGQPVLRFDGGENLTSAATIVIGMTHTAFVVFKSAVTAGPIIDHNAFAYAGAAHGFALLTTTGAAVANHTMVAGPGGNSGYDIADDWTDDAFRCVTQRIDGTHANHQLYVDGVLKAKDSVFSGSDPGSEALDASFFIASGFAGGTFFTGDIAEVIVYDAAISDADREDVEDYLMTKYGL